MNPEDDWEKLLNEESVRETRDLPDSFASGVLEKARAWKRAILFHRRMLISASVVAMVFATTVGLAWSVLSNGDQENPDQPPVSDLFQSDAGDFFAVEE